MRIIKYIFILLGLSGIAHAGPLNISNVPLELTPSVPPNVLILTDDSGSMDWEILTQNPDNSGAFCSPNVDGSCVVAGITHRVPEAGGPPSCQPYIDPLTATASGDYVSGYLYIVAFNSNDLVPKDLVTPANDPFIRNCYVARDDEFRVRNSIFNPLYFDPNNTYIPWAGVDINGNVYADADITNAPDDPYDPASAERINLTNQQSGMDISGNRISGNGFAYYEWNDANGDGIFDVGEETERLIKDQDASTQQNFANWFTYYRKREFVAKALAAHAVADNTASRVGFASTNQNANQGLRVALQNLSTLTGNKRALLDVILTVNSTGISPLRQSYEKVGKYFECTAGDIFNSTSSSIPSNTDCPALPAPGGTCQSNAAFIFSDGFDNGPSPSVGNADQDSTNDFDGGAFEDGFSNTFADVAIFYYKDDLQSLLSDDVPATSVDFIRDPNLPPVLQAGDTLHQHLKSNVVGIFNNLNSVIDTTFPGDATSSFTWMNPAMFPGTIDDLRHGAYNGRGNFIAASGERNFSSIMNEIDSTFKQAASNTGSTTAMAFNTQSIQEDTLVFRTFSNLANNSGELVAQRVNSDGSFNEDSSGNPIFEWSAATQVNAQAPNSRNIFSFNPAADQGIEFVLSDLTAAQITALENPIPATPINPIVQTRISYLRGDSSDEGTNFDNGEMRERVPLSTVDGITTGGKIGDIVHSSPVFVGIPPFINRTGGAFPSGSGDTYAEFRDANQNREPLVYVGANDGMLHSFYVKDTASADPGDERFAYIPDVLLNEVGNYTDPNYSHQFFVDLTPSVNDVYINPVTGASRQWRTVLVNGLGAGGKGYFALDITEPNNIDENDVMWEFSEADDGGVGTSDLGFTYSQPVIAMSNAPSSGDKDWVAIFGNGFNSTSANGNAVIYVLFLDNDYNGWTAGSDFIKIDTGIGKSTSVDGLTPNGISGVTAIDTDGNGTVDRAYAGDLQGNVYVIDFSSSSSSAWGISNTLFTATYESGAPTVSTPQPITTRPNVIANPSGGYIVLVGTGSYFTTDDAISTEIQSIYGLWDNPTGNTSTITKYSSPSQLVEQEFITNVDNSSGLVVRTVTTNTVTYNDSGPSPVRGWFIDFDIPPPGSSTGVQFPGERPVRNLQLRNSQLFFNTVIPQDGTSCAPPAGGFGLSVDAFSGSVGTNVIFDINIDGLFNQEDNLNGVNSTANIIVGTQFESAPSDNNFIGDYRVTQLANGDVDRILVNPALNNGALLGRHSWKEILN